LWGKIEEKLEEICTEHENSFDRNEDEEHHDNDDDNDDDDNNSSSSNNNNNNNNNNTNNNNNNNNNNNKGEYLQYLLLRPALTGVTADSSA
jgi:hypothetical protein